MNFRKIKIEIYWMVEVIQMTAEEKGLSYEEAKEWLSQPDDYYEPTEEELDYAYTMNWIEKNFYPQFPLLTGPPSHRAKIREWDDTEDTINVMVAGDTAIMIYDDNTVHQVSKKYLQSILL